MKVKSRSVIEFQPGRLSKTRMNDLYEAMLLPRMIEEKMLKLLRQGKVSKWFSGIGQEAIAAGVTKALNEDEIIFPMHRNLGVFTNRNIPLERLFCQWQGKEPGFTNGRDRSFHFGTLEHHIVGMISHLGPQLALACGVGLAYKLRKEKKVTVAFTGEGGTSEGDFHEAMNVAAVWQLPVIFLIENNGYGLSTPTNEQFRCDDLASKGAGYGMEAHIVDGNNVLEVYQTIDRIARKIRKKPQPVLIEFKTFRMRGHEEASGTKYVPKKLMTAWAKKDPVQNYEQFLLEEGIISSQQIEALREDIKQQIEAGLAAAESESKIIPELEKELKDVYKENDSVPTPPKGKKEEMRFIDAISDGLDQAMIRYPELVLMGQDIAEYGGVFKITDGFVKKYGLDRVRNTPICESAIIGAALGLSLEGIKSMVEMQFSDFVTCGFNQIVNNLAKLHYRWGQQADVVIRMPAGGSVSAGPFHSQSNEAWFFHTPGLKIAYPSNPTDAKGLLLASFEDPNPVLFFEHKALYRNLSEQVPTGYYTVELGKAAIAREGTHATVITYGLGVHWALEAASELDLDLEVIDLRSLSPLDYPAIETSVRKTNRAIILHEDTMTGGIGGELAAWIGEHLFEVLDAPVMRCASLDTPVPFATDLEQQFLPKNRFFIKIKELLSY